MDIQKLERNADIRIKFASINDLGGYDGDADEEYQSFFPKKEGKLEGDWVYKEVDGFIETRYEATRGAWELCHNPTQAQIAAVKHETGIEILILTGIASGVGTSAVIGLVKWGWKKWNTLRSSKANKVESGFIIEKVTDRFPDGRIRTVEKRELRPPLDHEVVNKCLTETFGV